MMANSRSGTASAAAAKTTATLPSRHCTQCTKAACCNEYHVYVIELHDDARLSSAMKGQNLEHEGERGVLYVGMTGHRPECRFEQHRTYAKKAKSFMCDCFGLEEERPFRGHGGRTKGSKVAGKHARYLRPKLFRKYNPIPTSDEAKAKEAELAEALRAKGYWVYQK